MMGFQRLGEHVPFLSRSPAPKTDGAESSDQPEAPIRSPSTPSSTPPVTKTPNGGVVVVDKVASAKTGPEPGLESWDSESDDSFIDASRRLRDEDGYEVGFLCRDEWPPSKKNSIEVLLPSSTLIYPESLYEGTGGIPEAVSERRALESLLDGDDDGDDDDAYEELQLDDFCVYSKSISKDTKILEMKPIYHLHGQGNSTLFFDGILSSGAKSRQVQGVPFARVSIGNYGDEFHSVSGNIWIQSERSAARNEDVHYRLGAPSQHYAPFFATFVWVADLSKYFTDFVKIRGIRSRPVSIADFRHNFHQWLVRHHGQDQSCRAWIAAYGKSDFCVPVARYINFLFNQCQDILGDKIWYHNIFPEIHTFTHYKAHESAVILDAEGDGDSPVLRFGKRIERNAGAIPPTVVTPYIADLFSHKGIPCRSVLKGIELSPGAEALRRKAFDEANLQFYHGKKGRPKSGPALPLVTANIQPGDTISTFCDAPGITNWEGVAGRKAAQDRADEVQKWYGLVQEVHVDEKNGRSFDVIWYYKPADTICCEMKYPYSNELFLSDNCTCGPNAQVHEDEVLGVHQVAFYPGLDDPSAEFVVRQTYLSGDRKWMTFHTSHTKCVCRRGDTQFSEFLRHHEKGDTVLARIRTNRPLDVCEIVQLGPEKYVTLRLLLRRSEFVADKAVRPNEVVYSEEIVTRPYSVIDSKCLVRFFAKGDAIPAPYSRNGVGNAWILSWKTADKVSYQRMGKAPASMKIGFHPRQKSETVTKLKGLDLFCGGGNFGRGLEEGGAIEMRWANDINRKAMHTYMANAPNPARVTPFIGSIDDLQRLAIEGQFSDEVPEIGQVNFISGGSPCPGFSLVTTDRTTPEQRKNQSLVASFASMIDVYRPKFGILENVPNIISAKKARSEDHFCQLICAIVGMGYQTRMFLGDAWSYGSCQSRQRVFLIFAAPGQTLPELPHPTHSHPDTTPSRFLGKLPNGDNLCERQFHQAYAFKHVSASEAMADLPEYVSADSRPGAGCIPFPDHVNHSAQRPWQRAQIINIPHFPRGMDFRGAWAGRGARQQEGAGVMTAAERDLYPGAGSSSTARNSRGWGRVEPWGLIRTVTTSQNPCDRMTGRCLHWDLDRQLTLMENRRAQGFPDHEAVLGSPMDRLRVIGNSVAREVALALGLSFREALVAGQGGAARRRGIGPDVTGYDLLARHYQATGAAGMEMGALDAEHDEKVEVEVEMEAASPSRLDKDGGSCNISNNDDTIASRTNDASIDATVVEMVALDGEHEEKVELEMEDASPSSPDRGGGICNKSNDIITSRADNDSIEEVHITEATAAKVSVKMEACNILVEQTTTTTTTIFRRESFPATGARKRSAGEDEPSATSSKRLCPGPYDDV